jgi:hypothetical protein
LVTKTLPFRMILTWRPGPLLWPEAQKLMVVSVALLPLLAALSLLPVPLLPPLLAVLSLPPLLLLVLFPPLLPLLAALSLLPVPLLPPLLAVLSLPPLLLLVLFPPLLPLLAALSLLPVPLLPPLLAVLSLPLLPPGLLSFLGFLHLGSGLLLVQFRTVPLASTPVVGVPQSPLASGLLQSLLPAQASLMPSSVKTNIFAWSPTGFSISAGREAAIASVSMAASENRPAFFSGANRLDVRMPKPPFVTAGMLGHSDPYPQESCLCSDCTVFRESLDDQTESF